MYSRLNPLITVHQLSEDLPLTWLDTPYELPLPRHQHNLPPSGPNLGVVIIPSDVILNTGEDIPSPETTVTTYRLQPNLDIIGDMYGITDQEIRGFSTRSHLKQTETLSTRWSNADSPTQSKWIASQCKWEADFSRVAEAVICEQVADVVIDTKTLPRLKNEIANEIDCGDIQFDTMYSLS